VVPPEEPVFLARVLYHPGFSYGNSGLVFPASPPVLTLHREVLLLSPEYQIQKQKKD